jgi:hypothetical protein
VGPSTNRQAAGTPSGTAGGRLWLVVVGEVTPRPAHGLRCLEWMSGSSALINDHDPVDVQEPTSSDADRRPAYLQVSTALGAYKLVSGRSSVRSRPPARCAPDQGRHQRTITRTGSLGASRACKAYRLPGLGRVELNSPGFRGGCEAHGRADRCVGTPRSVPTSRVRWAWRRGPSCARTGLHPGPRTTSSAPRRCSAGQRHGRARGSRCSKGWATGGWCRTRGEARSAHSVLGIRA